MKTTPENLLYYILYMLGKEPYELKQVDTPEGKACLLNLQRLGGDFIILFSKEDVELLRDIEALGTIYELTIAAHVKECIEKGVSYKNL